ncbi:MAG TPA: M23 family metallopeptidase [Vitreimonas sp.]|nr:M23 family metallopeptidase [Vitreimonas sp.]
MIRQSFLALVAALALAGCAASGATYSAPISYPSTPRPTGPSIYATAPRAVVQSQLIACNGGAGSNIGEIGFQGESIAYTPYIDTPAGALLRNPTEGACLSSGFGWRGALESGRQHNGLDLANPNGGFIYAAGNGRITYADYRGGYGNVVEIDHGAGVRTLYAHLSEIDQRLRPGDRISAGTAIARMGMTGNATGVHLHYEVWIDGLLVDPLHYGRPPVYVSAPAAEPTPIETAPSDAPDITMLSDEEAADVPPPVALQTIEAQKPK